MIALDSWLHQFLIYLKMCVIIMGMVDVRIDTGRSHYVGIKFRVLKHGKKTYFELSFFISNDFA
jgi:hypothetical protein